MIEILHEDNHILVCVKPAGILSQPDKSGGADMIALILEHMEANRTGSDIHPVHRLDRNVGGVMVYAKNKAAAAKLSKAIQDNGFRKEYVAVVHNRPAEEKGTYKDLLFKDSSRNKSFVVDRPRKGVKEASLEYEVMETKDLPVGPVTLVKIRLHTGRTHQIRVQFSSRQMPLLGDGKYGSRDNGCELALWSYRLSFWHPDRKEYMEFTQAAAECYPWDIFTKYTREAAR